MACSIFIKAFLYHYYLPSRCNLLARCQVLNGINPLPMSLFRWLVSGLMAGLFLSSCQAEAPQSEQPASSPAADTTQVAASSDSTNLPAADSSLAGIPIFKTFEEIAPLFQQDNDTTYVINFWATWCKPCVKELPYFEALTEAYQGEKVEVVLISLDFPRQIESKLVPFVKERQLQSEVLVLLDGKYNDWIDRVSPDWSGAIPATLIYKGAERRLIGQAVENTEELREAVEAIR